MCVFFFFTIQDFYKRLMCVLEGELDAYKLYIEYSIYIQNSQGNNILR